MRQQVIFTAAQAREIILADLDQISTGGNENNDSSSDPGDTSRGALGGKPKCSVQRVGLEPTTHRSRVEHATN